MWGVQGQGWGGWCGSRHSLWGRLSWVPRTFWGWQPPVCANQDDCSPQSTLLCETISAQEVQGSENSPRAGGASFILQTVPSVILGAFRGTATPCSGPENDRPPKPQ